MSKRTVWPVDGLFLQDVPAIEHECDDPFCVESGAFTDKPPPAAKAPATTEAPENPGPSDSASKE